MVRSRLVMGRVFSRRRGLRRAWAPVAVLLLCAASASGQAAGEPTPEELARLEADRLEAERQAEVMAAFATWREGLGDRLTDEVGRLAPRLEKGLAAGTGSWGRDLRKPFDRSSSRSVRNWSSRASRAEDKARPLLADRARLGLLWLLAHQSEGGWWSVVEHDVECGRLGPSVCRTPGVAGHDVGITALSVLCLLAADPAPDGSLGPPLAAALEFLASRQSESGRVETHVGGKTNYDHMLATLALCRAVRLGHAVHDEAARAAVDHILAVRRPAGVWRYDFDDGEMITHPYDTSVTSWALLALCEGRRLGHAVPDEVVSDVLEFFDEMTSSEGRVGYYAADGKFSSLAGLQDRESESLTAVTLLARRTALEGRWSDRGLDRVLLGLDRLRALPPEWDGMELVDYYYWSAATRLMSELEVHERGPWMVDLVDVVAATGLGEDDALGSWEPVDAWSPIGGRVYATSIMTWALLELSAEP